MHNQKHKKGDREIDPLPYFYFLSQTLYVNSYIIVNNEKYYEGRYSERSSQESKGVRNRTRSHPQGSV